MNLEDCFYLGTIVAKYSFKGEVLLKTDTDTPENYTNLKSVFINTGTDMVPFFIKKVQLHKSALLRIRFDEISNEQDAESILKKKAYLPLSSLPPLTGKRFYYHEVIGFEVFNGAERIGILEGVNDQTVQHLFDIKGKRKNILIPIHDDFIEEVNRKQKRMVLILPEGLLEL